jgi:hypothetical protein
LNDSTTEQLVKNSERFDQQEVAVRQKQTIMESNRYLNPLVVDPSVNGFQIGIEKKNISIECDGHRKRL